MTLQELLTAAGIIKNETGSKKNTQSRIGLMFENIINSLFHKDQVKQVTGSSTTDVVSQKVVTDELALKFDKSSLESARSQSTTKSPTSKLVDDELNKKAIYNVTNEVPLTAGQYYTQSTAIAAVPTASRKTGLVITYATSSGVWVSEQYKGSDTSVWTTTSNWITKPNEIEQTRSQSTSKVPSSKLVDDELSLLSVFKPATYNSNERLIIPAIKDIKVFGTSEVLKLVVAINTVDYPKRLILSSASNPNFAIVDFGSSNQFKRLLLGTGVVVEVSVDWELLGSNVLNVTYLNSNLTLANSCYKSLDRLFLGESNNFTGNNTFKDPTSDQAPTTRKITEIANKSFIDSIEPTFTADEIAVIKAIKGIKIYNANPARKYLIRFVCNNDSTFKYNICIADKITGVEQIQGIASVTTPGGLNFITMIVTLGSDSPVTIKLAIDYSGLSNRVYMNGGYAASNLVPSKQTYADVKTEDLTGFATSINANTTAISEVYVKQNAITWSSGYWQSNGVLGYYVNYGHSGYLKTKPGATISVSGLGSVGGAATAKVMSFFDANLVWICYSDLSTLTVDANLSANYLNIAFVSFSTSDYIALPPTIVISINNNTQLDQTNARVTSLENVSLSTKNKSMAVLGDSIMMLMRTNSVGTNTVTFVGSDSNVYTVGQLTNIGGRLYVTTTLVGGQPGVGTIECEVTNSQQANYDAQNWDSLKTKLGLSELINCGLGGATIAERNYVTAYPYPDGDGYTTCISNEARMLKRLVTAGRVTPDMIMIWAGTNGAGQPSTDNYDTIMALDWATLSDNVLGLAYRQTFYGGLRFTLEYLYRNFQYATIYVYSPIQTNPADYRTYSALTTTRNALEKMAKRYACIFCDALTESGIVDLFEKADGTGYWLGDGLHPKQAGKVLMKNYTHRKITSTYFNKKD